MAKAVKAAKDAALKDSVLEAVRAKHGEDAALRLDGTTPFQVVETTSSGALTLDAALGGGWARGRIVELYGHESCLAASTFVHFHVSVGGRLANSKGGTIERLWERFHGAAVSGKGKYIRAETLEATYSAPALNEERRVFHNEVVDVVRTGAQECFEVMTLSGERIEATSSHKFLTPSGWKCVGDLATGDYVLLHNNTPFQRAEAITNKRVDRAMLYVKHHPVAGVKVIRPTTVRGEKSYTYEYEYSRLLRARAVIEARMNELSLQEYVERLDAGHLDGLRFLTRLEHVHHIDENELNDSLDNLVVLSAEEHGRKHALERHNNLRFAAVEDLVISIVPVGVRETYDLKMAAPFHNYVANRFVVHNSGKTTLALHAIAEVQRLDEAAAFIDAEHALDTQYAEALGVDLARLYLSQPDSGEQALDIVETFVQTGDVSLVVIDSVAALTPLCELEGAMGDQHVGAQARLMSRALRKLASIANKKRCTLIFLNQIRMKIGVMYGNPETTPGGNALKFYSSQRLQCGRRAHIKSGEEAVGNHINVKVVKNKVAVPFQEADLSIVWGKGVDRYADLLEAAVATGVVTKAGAWYSVGERKLAQGANTAALRLAEDAELHAQVYADTRRLMLGGRHAAR